MVLPLTAPMKTRRKEKLKHLGEMKGLGFEGDSLIDAMVKKQNKTKTTASSIKTKLLNKYALGGGGGNVGAYL